MAEKENRKSITKRGPIDNNGGVMQLSQSLIQYVLLRYDSHNFFMEIKRTVCSKTVEIAKKCRIQMGI